MEEVDIFGDRQRVRLTTTRWPDGFEAVFDPLDATEYHPRPGRFVIRMRVRSPTKLHVSGIPAPSWSMARGLWVGERSLMQATRWAHGIMFPRDRLRFPPIDPARSQSARADMRRLYGRLRALAIHAADACDQQARRVAMRFTHHLRFRLYERLVADKSARLAQLAESCPGAIIFALGLMEGGAKAAAAGQQLLADTVAGRRLNDALDEAIAVWRQEAEPLSQPRKPPGTGWGKDVVLDEWRMQWVGLAWQHVFRDRRRRPLIAQRLLIRRAGPLVPTTNLQLPPPLAFAAEDIPQSVRANARWYRCVKSHPALVLGAPGLATLDGARTDALSSFLSRNAAEVMAWKDVTWPSQAGWLIDWMQATRRTPARASSARAILEECRRWHSQMTRVRDIAAFGGDDASCVGDLNAPFPEPPLPGWRDDQITGRPIRTPAELFEESEHLHHCVDALLFEAIAGRAFIYSVEIAGKRLTVHIQTTTAGLRIVEAKGFANRALTRSERVAIRAWLESAVPS